jgi:hypothetical protein
MLPHAHAPLRDVWRGKGNQSYLADDAACEKTSEEIDSHIARSILAPVRGGRQTKIRRDL